MIGRGHTLLCSKSPHPHVPLVCREKIRASSRALSEANPPPLSSDDNQSRIRLPIGRTHSIWRQRRARRTSTSRTPTRSAGERAALSSSFHPAFTFEIVSNFGFCSLLPFLFETSPESRRHGTFDAARTTLS